MLCHKYRIFAHNGKQHFSHIARIALTAGKSPVFTISLRIAIILSLDGIMVPPHPGSGIKVARRSGSQRGEPVLHDLFFCRVLEMVRLNIH
jgi:hypothetical protein